MVNVRGVPMFVVYVEVKFYGLTFQSRVNTPFLKGRVSDQSLTKTYVALYVSLSLEFFELTTVNYVIHLEISRSGNKVKRYINSLGKIWKIPFVSRVLIVCRFLLKPFDLISLAYSFFIEF